MAKNTLTGRVVDGKGNALEGFSVGLSGTKELAIVDSKGESITKVTTEGNGHFSVVTTSLVVGIHKLTVTAGSAKQTVDSIFKLDTGSASIWPGNLVVKNNPAPADGKRESTVEATVWNNQKIPLEGIEVQFTATDGAIIQSKATTNSSGIAIAKLTSTYAGLTTITAEVKGTGTTVDATFEPDRDTTTIKLKPEFEVVKAHAAEGVKVTVRAEDENKNLITNVQVELEATTGEIKVDGVVTKKITIGSTGVRDIIWSSKDANDGVLKATWYVNKEKKTATAKVKFEADESTVTIKLQPEPKQPKANSKDKVMVKVTALDGNNNVIKSGVEVSLTASIGSVPKTIKTTQSGSVDIDWVSGKKADKGVLTAEWRQKGTAKKTTADVTFIADIDTLWIKTEVPANVVADGKPLTKIQVTVLDVNDNPFKGEKVYIRHVDGKATVERGDLLETNDRGYMYYLVAHDNVGIYKFQAAIFDQVKGEIKSKVAEINFLRNVRVTAWHKNVSFKNYIDTCSSNSRVGKMEDYRDYALAGGKFIGGLRDEYWTGSYSDSKPGDPGTVYVYYAGSNTFEEIPKPTSSGGGLPGIGAGLIWPEKHVMCVLK
ncbi:hypothetical protein EMIT0P265_370001 [Pseudomonas zeae]